eukprot:scaffold6665_cov53-Attheya_sp.AAC.2
MASLSTGIHERSMMHPVPGRSRQRVSRSGGVAVTAMKSVAQGGDVEVNEKSRFSPHRVSVGIILLSAFLNLLGFTMAGPITPALGKHFGLEVGASFGSLTSAYPLGMLAGLFLWPQLSDKIGRKPVIAVSLLGSGLGLAAQSMVIQREGALALFLASRVLTGSFAGSSPVSKAYLADVGYKNGKLPKYLALRDAASTMAFVAGPALGGLMFELRRRFLGLHDATDVFQTSGSLAFVIRVSALASLVAGALVGFFVQEVPIVETKKQEDDKNADHSIISCPLGTRLWAGVASICVVSFLFNLGDSTFHAFFSALLRDRANMDTKSIGLTYTLLACISLSVSAGFTGKIMGKFGPVATCAAGLSFIGSGLLALGAVSTGTAFIPSYLVLGAAACYYCGVPLYGPTIPTMLLRCVPPNRRGAVMGLDGAINTIGRVIAPLAMGELYRKFGPSAAFGVAGGMAFLAVLITLVRRFVVLRQESQ